MEHKKLFIFDVDGTLVNSYAAISKSLNFTRKRLKHPAVSFSKVKVSVGRGDKLFIKTFFSAAEAARALRIYREHHRKTLVKYAKLYPHTRAVLIRLRRRGKILAVASNRPARFTDILLKSLNIKQYFHAVYCADTIKSLKPNPKILRIIMRRFNIRACDTVYVGDMDIDMQTAQAAGIDAVFKKGGSSTLAEVKRYKIAKVINSINELL